jgi:hypothetical protein
MGRRRFWAIEVAQQHWRIDSKSRVTNPAAQPGEAWSETRDFVHHDNGWACVTKTKHWLGSPSNVKFEGQNR